MEGGYRAQSGSAMVQVRPGGLIRLFFPTEGLTRMESVLAWAAVIKYCRLGDLNSRNLFLTVLEAAHLLQLGWPVPRWPPGFPPRLPALSKLFLFW